MNHERNFRSQGNVAAAEPPRSSRESLLTADDLYLFNQGTHVQLYDKLGAHLRTLDGAPGVQFAVWAPNARSVTVRSGAAGDRLQLYADSAAQLSPGRAQRRLLARSAQRRRSRLRRQRTGQRRRRRGRAFAAARPPLVAQHHAAAAGDVDLETRRFALSSRHIPCAVNSATVGPEKGDILLFRQRDLPFRASRKVECPLFHANAPPSLAIKRCGAGGLRV